MDKLKSKSQYLDIFKYSLGGLGVTLVTNLVMSYLNFFLTDIFGITTFAVAGIMLVSRIIDAVTDPVMGMIADRTKSRWGKFRPWILFFSPVLGVAIFTLFYTPAISESMKVVYAYAIFIFYSIAVTIVSVPYFALVPVLSKDAHMRTVIISWKSVMCQIAVLCITVFALPLVNAFGGGQKGWASFGALIGVVSTVLLWVAANGAKPYDKLSKDEEKKEKKSTTWKEIKILFKTKPLLVLVLAFGLSMLANTLLNSANMYYFKYVLHREEWIPIIMGVSMGASILASVVLPQLEAKFGKKRLFVLSSVICAVPLLILGMKPEVPLAALIVTLVIFGFTYGLASSLPWAMVPDCIDYAEWKYEVQPNGLFTATFTFVQKCGTALGGFLSGILLGVAGFAANQEQTKESLQMIVSLRFLIPAVLFVVTMAVLYFYEITPEKTKAISAELEKRNGLGGSEDE